MYTFQGLKIQSLIKTLNILLLGTTCTLHELLAEEHPTLNLQVSPFVTDFEFREFRETNTVVREHGRLRGIELQLEYQTAGFFFRGVSSYLTNTVDYDGQTQSGIPINAELFSGRSHY